MMIRSQSFVLLGSGIAYSASPAMMAAAFEALALPHTYTLEDIPANEVADMLDALREATSFGGANVTTPHKPAVADLMDERSSAADEAHAVNTVVRDRSGRLVGHNTDIPAIAAAVHRLRPDGVDHALILGGGGAARGVEMALAQCGAAQVRLLQRADGTWERLAAAIGEADLVINATPIGTRSDDSPIPSDLLRPDLAMLDLVYRPSPTRLVRDARDHGAPAEAGAGVLLDQGALSLELWLGVPAPRAAMANALRRELGDGADVSHALDPLHA
jgi:shikimate dehydrogenase